MNIRNQSGPSLGSESSTTALRQQVLHKHTGKRKKSSAPSASKIASYGGAFIFLIAVVAIGYETPQKASTQAAVVNGHTEQSAVNEHDNEPTVDEVVATGVAADLASRANLPIAENVASMSTSLAAKNDLSQTDASAITKPQIIQPNSSRTDVITYTVIEGDTVPSIAAKFGISADTVRWANDLGNTDVVTTGKVLSILQTNGLLHTVAAGDTLESIASKYTSNADRITTMNNLELSGISANQRLIIPDGVKPAPVIAPLPAVTSQSSGGTLGGSRLNVNLFASAGNRYADGNCTWYVYERRAQMGKPIGSYWGNANTWDSSATAAGFTVGRVPQPGSIIQWDEYSEPYVLYAGHVGVVERVLENGDIVITEMNNSAYGGFNIVNQRTISAAQAAQRKYIY